MRPLVLESGLDGVGADSARRVVAGSKPRQRRRPIQRVGGVIRMGTDSVRRLGFFGLGPIQLVGGLCGEESDSARWMAIEMGTDSTLGWLPAGVPARNNCRSGSRARLYTPCRPILRSESGFGRCAEIRSGMRRGFSSRGSAVTPR